MAGIKSLARDTAVYGLSSIVGRFLNWLLVPLYTNMFVASEYGIVTYLYAYVAVVLIILTYGLETGFFRFSNHERYGSDPTLVYSTSLISLASSSTLFIAALFAALGPLSSLLGCAAHPSYVWMLGVTVALDAFTAIPFCYLRFRKRPMRFALLKLIGIGLNIGLNLWFILVCPWIWEQAPGLIAWFYDPAFGIGYIFLANLIASAVTLLLVLPELRGFSWRFDSALWRRMIVYSFPLLVLGIAGIMNQSLGTILLPSLWPDRAEADTMLGIYGANYKIAIVMVMFIQAFRFAYEPFIFAQNREAGGSKLQAYRDAMKFFVIFAGVIFLGVMFYIDILRYFISSRYWSGLAVVPVLMAAEFFFGVFFNLSLWYKLTDRTIWGTWFSLLGLAVTVGGNVLLVPRIGYMGCAWAAFACYGVMMVASYAVGAVKYPVGYDLRRIGFYVAATVVAYVAARLLTTGSEAVDYAVRTLLLCGYLFMIVRIEHISPLSIMKRRARS